MMWFALVVAVVLVALTVAGVLGSIRGGSLAPAATTASYVPLPGDRLTPADLESLRLDTAFRGYRMDQVDEVIGRLGEEIRALTQQLDGTGAEREAEAEAQREAETAADAEAETAAEAAADAEARAGTEAERA